MNNLMANSFDLKVLRRLQTLREPWRIPQAAQLIPTDCAEAQEIIARYLKAGWVRMTAPGQYKLTRSGHMTIDMVTVNADKDPESPAFARQENVRELHVLTSLAACEPATSESVSAETRLLPDAVRKYLNRFRDQKWARAVNTGERFREWYLTEAGRVRMEELGKTIHVKQQHHEQTD